MVCQVHILVAPFACKVLHDEGVVQDVPRAVEQELKVNVDAESARISSLVVNLIVLSVAQGQQGVQLTGKAQLKELLEAQILGFSDTAGVFRHQGRYAVLLSLLTCHSILRPEQESGAFDCHFFRGANLGDAQAKIFNVYAEIGRVGIRVRCRGLPVNFIARMLHVHCSDADMGADLVEVGFELVNLEHLVELKVLLGGVLGA